MYVYQKITKFFFLCLFYINRVKCNAIFLYDYKKKESGNNWRQYYFIFCPHLRSKPKKVKVRFILINLVTRILFSLYIFAFPLNM